MANPKTILPGVEIRLRELAVNGTNYVGFKAPDSIAANVLWTLPTADGPSGNEVLTTDGFGNLTWAVNGQEILSLNNTWTGTNTSTNTTEATTGGAGSIKTAGGIFASKAIISDSDTASTTTTTGGIIQNGAGAATSVGIGGGAINAGGAIAAGGAVSTTDATEATTGGAGSVTAAGGIFATKKIITSTAVRTGAPTTGTAQDWKLGSAITSGTSVLDATKYVEVEINGALVKLAVVTNS